MNWHQIEGIRSRHNNSCINKADSMVNHHISNDTYHIAMWLRAQGCHTPEEIADDCGISSSSYQRALHCYHTTETAAKADVLHPGRPRLFTRADTSYFISLANHNPTRFLDEYRQLIMDNRFLPASKATLHCEFLHANINLKQVEKVVKERNPTKIARFLQCVLEYPANYLVSVDEVSKPICAFLDGHQEESIVKQWGHLYRNTDSQCWLLWY